jgi:hypothetical protein
LGFEENEEEGVTGDGVGRGHEEEGEEFAAHGISSFQCRTLRFQENGLPLAR